MRKSCFTIRYELETRKAGAIAVGTAVGVAAFAGIYSWFSSKDDDKKHEDKKEQKKIKGPETIEQNESYSNNIKFNCDKIYF